jgi:hypothetical protein
MHLPIPALCTSVCLHVVLYVALGTLADTLGTPICTLKNYFHLYTYGQVRLVRLVRLIRLQTGNSRFPFSD